MTLLNNHELGSIHLANRKELHWAVEKERFCGKGEEKEIISKEWIVSGKVALLRGTEGPMGRITSLSADQVIPA